jgi:hypothetical protein
MTRETQEKQTNQSEQAEPFQYKLIQPYSTRIDGNSVRVPYVIDGLLIEGGLSALAAKPKQGKSSISRAQAVCVATGTPFLGRETVQGEVILISLEDPLFHVDNCLEGLSYQKDKDASIHIIDRLAPTVDESIAALHDLLSHKPDVRLVVIDTLAKFIRVTDMNEYMPVLKQMQKLHDLAREFPFLHIEVLAHCKKAGTEDTFDALLGSTAVRAETDTNIALYQERSNRIIVTETRVGRSIPPTIFQAELVNIGGSDVVKSFTLLEPLGEYQAEKAEKKESKKQINFEEQVITYLASCEGDTAPQELTLDSVRGRREDVKKAIDRLEEQRVIKITGIRRSPVDPLKLTLIRESIPMYEFVNRFNGRPN